jgi:hypothetical protein
MAAPKFSIKQIADIAAQVRRYKTLHVTTEGVMFRTKRAAEEAVRTRNMIFEDATQFVAIKEITESDVTNEKLRSYAKDLDAFNELFKDAYVPVHKGKKAAEKKDEGPAPISKSEEDEIMAALKGEADAQPEAAKTEADAQPEAAKTEADAQPEAAKTEADAQPAKENKNPFKK